MSTPSPLVMNALKTAIRTLLDRRQWKYRDLAGALGVSEPTIKRWMTADDLSLGRIGRIAEAFGLTAFELLRRAEVGGEQSFVLPEATEAALAAHPEARLVWNALQLGRTPAAVQQHYGYDDAGWLRVLGQLEQWNLVERHAGGRVRMLHVGVHNWLPEGPLARRHRDMWRPWVQDAWDRTGPDAVVQCATRAVAPGFYEDAEEALRALAYTWRNRAWRDQTAVPTASQERVRWMLVVARAPEWPEL